MTVMAAAEREVFPSEVPSSIEVAEEELAGGKLSLGDSDAVDIVALDVFSRALVVVSAPELELLSFD